MLQIYKNIESRDVNSPLCYSRISLLQVTNRIDIVRKMMDLLFIALSVLN